LQELATNAVFAVLFAVVALQALALASYRLGPTASVFAITFIELLALSLAYYGGAFGLSLDVRFFVSGIFLSLLPAALLAAYFLLGIRAARSVLVMLVAGLVGYTLAWTLPLSAAPLFGNVPLEFLPTHRAWLLGILGIVAETAGFLVVVPLYSFLGRRLRLPHWGRIAATLAVVPNANALVMLAGTLFYSANSGVLLLFAQTLAARALTGLLLTPGILLFLRAHLRGSRDAPLSVSPLDALGQLTSTRRNLEEIEARYQAMFAAAPDAILLFDREGIIRTINQRAEQELGYGPGELTGLPVWRLWGPTDDEAESERRIRIRLKKTRVGDVTEFEGIARRADGSRLPVVVSLAAVGGPMPEFLAIAHDLTRQKRDQERLRQQVAELNALAEVAHTASSAQDVTGLLKASADRVVETVSADSCYVTLWDETRSQVIFAAASGDAHESFRSLAPGTLGEGPSLTLDALAEGRPIIVHDFSQSRYCRPRLVLGPAMQSLLALPLIGDDQKLGALVVGHVQTHDFSADEVNTLERAASLIALAIGRMRLQQQTERRLQELTAIYESGRRLQRLQPPESLAQEAVNALAEILGYDHSSVMLVDKPSGDLRTVALGERGCDSASIEAEKVRIAQFGVRLGLGLTGWVAAHGESVRVGDVAEDPRYLAVRDGIRSELCVPLGIGEEVIGVINVESALANAYTQADQRLLETVAAQVAIAIQNARLYEDLQNAYEQLKASQDDAMRAERLRALGQMASGIAHDFNNALTPIIGYLELALEHPDLPQSVRGDIEQARRGALAASGIVARLREFYRPRDRAEDFAPVEINRIVGEAVELTRPRWRDIPQEHGAVIDVRLELGQVPRVMGDAGALRDLLTNLIINAVDAMPRGGAIQISTSRDDTWVLVTVADTGTGMNKEIQRLAFEPFFSTKGSQGTGLGLSICYGIAQRHGGTIDLRSAPGKGTEFFVRLPVSVSTVPVGPETALPALPPLHILLVDDEPPVLAVVSRMLARAGHRVLTAPGGKAGIDAFVPGEVDIVITDLGMPQVTGREVARAIKARSPQTPVILLTGWGAKMGQEQGAPEEVDDILTKPIQAADLHRSLARVLGLLPRP
jgi:PAS domain S-box-containing protein